MKAWALSLLLPAIAAAYPVEVLKQSGPADKRIDLVILGDGYRVQDQAQLTDDVKQFTAKLFDATPFKEYESLFNVRLIHVVSNQNGADRGSHGEQRDTALGAYFYCGNIERLVCIDHGSVASILSTHTPDYDVALVVVNDPKYGGSGGSIPVTSIDVNAAEIAIHELGHAVGGLADEYESPNPAYPPCGQECDEANATKNATASVKWSAWIATATPIPTPEDNATYAANIGVFEGCRFEAVGVYRPKDSDCKMKQLGQPYCSVCAEQMTKSFWNRVPTHFDAAQPFTADVGAVCGEVDFAVVLPPGPVYQYAWYVDGGVQAETGSTFRFTPGADVATVSVTVRDNTTLVRADPDGLLDDTTSWTVVGAGVTCLPGLCDVSAACGSDGGCERMRKDAGSVCGEPICRNGARTAIGTCDGAGGCVSAVISSSCGTYGCDDAGVDCRTSCRSAEDCAVGHQCESGICFADAGTPRLEPVEPDSGVVVTPPIREVKLPAATAEQPVAKSCGCGSAGAPVVVFALASVALRRRRS